MRALGSIKNPESLHASQISRDVRGMQAAKVRRKTRKSRQLAHPSPHSSKGGGASNFSSSERKPMLNLKRISAGLSLVMLALGFFLLGILSFIQRPQGELAMASALEKSCVVAGSAVSVLAGAIFLFAACIYWNR